MIQYWPNRSGIDSRYIIWWQCIIFMADRNQLAQEVKQLKAEQETRTAEWKETQAKLETKAAELVQANIDELG